MKANFKSPKGVAVIVLLFFYAVLGLVLSGCTVTMPVGENGRYGEVFAGYRLPGAGGNFGDVLEEGLRK